SRVNRFDAKLKRTSNVLPKPDILISYRQGVLWAFRGRCFLTQRKGDAAARARPRTSFQLLKLG
ncbi:hypothetical protein NKI77_05425, partial [Mesorhizobium opportunistum]